jgi:hypothetical protein
MRPLFIGQLLPFTAKPIWASRLNYINLRKFTYPSLDARGRKKYFAVTSTKTLSPIVCPHHWPVSWLAISAILPPCLTTLAISPTVKEVFEKGPALFFYLFFGTGNTPDTAQIIPRTRKTLFRCLADPARSFLDRATP